MELTMAKGTLAHGGRTVFHGLDPAHYSFCEGWTEGHDDGLEGQPLDSTLAVEDSPYAKGYRHGYMVAKLTSGGPDNRTLLGVGGIQ